MVDRRHPPYRRGARHYAIGRFRHTLIWPHFYLLPCLHNRPDFGIENRIGLSDRKHSRMWPSKQISHTPRHSCSYLPVPPIYCGIWYYAAKSCQASTRLPAGYLCTPQCLSRCCRRRSELAHRVCSISCIIYLSTNK